MDWGYKAVLTAAVVATVMMAARLFGRQAAGLLAGLPVITTPALLWLAEEQGAAFAAASAVGSLAACVAAAAFAAAFERVARRRGAGAALAAGVVALAAAAFATQSLAGRPLAALLAAALACALAYRAVVVRPAHGTWVRPLRGEPWLSAVLAGTVSALVSLLALRVGAFWSGMLSTLPIISACALVHLRLAGGAGDVTRFVAGYLPGLFAKALFLFVFALLTAHLGALVALGPSLGVGAIGALVLARARRAAAGSGAAHAADTSLRSAR
jgi:hypothetical protein